MSHIPKATEWTESMSPWTTIDRELLGVAVERMPERMPSTRAMRRTVTELGGEFSTNAKQAATTTSWDEAHTWLQQDKANRVIETVKQGASAQLGPGSRLGGLFPPGLLPGSTSTPGSGSEWFTPWSVTALKAVGVWEDKQVLWERVDKNKPSGFTPCRTDGTAYPKLNFYPEARWPGGCLDGIHIPTIGHFLTGGEEAP